MTSLLSISCNSKIVLQEIMDKVFAYFQTNLKADVLSSPNDKRENEPFSTINTERLFSIVNQVWADGRSRMSLNTVSNISVLKFNCQCRQNVCICHIENG